MTQTTIDTPRTIASIFGTVRVYPDQTPFYHQGDEARRIYRVNSGVVMNFRLLENSQRQITGFCTEGDFFGLSGDGTHHDGAVSVTTSGVQSLSTATLIDNPASRAELLAHSYQRVEDAQCLMMTMSRKSSHEKVAAFLLIMAERKGASEDMPCEVRLPMSRLDIADFLGMSRETVSRRLTDLEETGIITLDGVHGAAITALDRLRSCAGAMA